MPVAAVIAAALTTAAPKSKSLWVAGLDVLRQPGTPGSLYGTAISSIEVTERLPGLVSGMTFRITDPAAAVAVAKGDTILYFDHELDLPLFRGWVDTWTPEPLPGGQGRAIDVEAIGVEAVLDWAMLLEDMTIPAGGNLRDAIQRLAGAAVGTGPLRAFSLDGGTNSSIAQPISENTAAAFAGGLSTALTLKAGTSLRECLRQVARLYFTASAGAVFAFTVDYFYGLRAELHGPLAGPFTFVAWADRATFSVSTGAGQRPSGNRYRTDGQVYRGVFVKGANAAGTGLVVDGSGTVGPIAVLNDDASDTAGRLLDIGRTYLQQSAEAVRGDVVAEAVDPADVNSLSAWFRPGCQLTITESAVGLSGAAHIATELRKRFHADGTEDWSISYGGVPPSAAQLIRRLALAPRAA